MTDKREICYSLGRNKYDNIPCQVVANSFEVFEKNILSTRSSKKGEIFFSSGFASGQHTNTGKYPDKSTYRLKKLALPRRFMPLDFDDFITPVAYENLTLFLKGYRGFGYETWSHTPSSPRARAVLELSRPITADESTRIGVMLELEIIQAIGSEQIKFDRCVYQLEQPVYVAPKDANSFIFGGDVLNVDRMLTQHLRIQSIELKMPSQRGVNKVDEVTRALIGKIPPPDESPRQIAKLKAMLDHISADCDYEIYRRVIWAVLSTEWDCAEDIAHEWSLTASDRFNQRTFDDLVYGFNPGLPTHPTVGSIKFLAEQGGWNE